MTTTATKPRDTLDRALCWRARHAETAQERLEARNELIMRTQGLIYAETQQLYGRFRTSLVTHSMHDLVGEGQLGLMRAIDRYPLDSPTPFAAYAAAAIRQTMRNYLWNNRSVIRVPWVSRVQRERRKGEVTAQDCARAVSVQRLPPEVPKPEPSSVSQRKREIARRKVGEMIDVLTQQQRDVLSAYYGLEPAGGMSVGEMIRHLGISWPHAYRVRRAAEKKLRLVFIERLKPIEVDPCGRCGNPGGWTRPNARCPDRLNGVPFGYPQKICRSCYERVRRIRLAERKAVSA